MGVARGRGRSGATFRPGWLRRHGLASRAKGLLVILRVEAVEQGGGQGGARVAPLAGLASVRS